MHLLSAAGESWRSLKPFGLGKVISFLKTDLEMALLLSVFHGIATITPLDDSWQQELRALPLVTHVQHHVS